MAKLVWDKKLKIEVRAAEIFSGDDIDQIFSVVKYHVFLHAYRTPRVE